MKPIFRILPGIAWFFLILYLLTIPGKDLPQANWMDALHVDKIIHVGLFFLLTLFFFWGIVSTKPGIDAYKLVITIAVSGLCYGILLEFVQKYWIPNRSFDGWDILADGIGCFLPLLLISRMRLLLKF